MTPASSARGGLRLLRSADSGGPFHRLVADADDHRPVAGDRLTHLTNFVGGLTHGAVVDPLGPSDAGCNPCEAVFVELTADRVVAGLVFHDHRWKDDLFPGSDDQGGSVLAQEGAFDHRRLGARASREGDVQAGVLAEGHPQPRPVGVEVAPVVVGTVEDLHVVADLRTSTLASVNRGVDEQPDLGFTFRPHLGSGRETACGVWAHGGRPGAVRVQEVGLFGYDVDHIDLTPLVRGSVGRHSIPSQANWVSVRMVRTLRTSQPSRKRGALSN